MSVSDAAFASGTTLLACDLAASNVYCPAVALRTNTRSDAVAGCLPGHPHPGRNLWVSLQPLTVVLEYGK